MTNTFYNHDDGVPPAQQRGQSAPVRAEFDKIQVGFDGVQTAINNTTALPGQTSNAGRALVTNGMAASWGQVVYFDPVNFRMGIGTITPDSPIAINKNTAALPLPIADTCVHIGGQEGTVTRILLDSWGTNNGLSGRRANGYANAPSALNSGDSMLNIVGFGYGTTTYTGGKAYIRLIAAQNWSDVNQGTKIVFGVTPNNTTTPVETTYIENNGSIVTAGPLLVGTQTPPAASFGIVPSALNATTSGGIAAAQQNYSVDNTLYGTVAAVNYGLGTYFQIAAISRGLDLTGTTVTAPTPAAGNNTTQVATTAFVVTHSTSGTYTPTLAAVLNAGALTAHKCQYQRINNIVTVSGTADLTPTAGGATIVSLTLPVASNFAIQQDANGAASAGNAVFVSASGAVYADAATDTARILFNAPTAGSATTVAFSFQYEVL